MSEEKITKEMILEELSERDDEDVAKAFGNIVGKNIADDEDVEVKVVEKDQDQEEDSEEESSQDSEEESSQDSETVSFTCEAEVEADMFEE